MIVQLELWHLISLLLAFFACIGGFGLMLFNQVDKRLDARFGAMEDARRDSQGAWIGRFDELKASAADEREQWHRVERDLLALRVELPEKYVRREDWVRSQSILESKIDGLALRIENVMLRKNNND